MIRGLVEKADNMSDLAEIPFWLFGQLKWVSGINKNTSCQEVVRALFKSQNISLNPAEFIVIEKWRKIERRLGCSRKILKVWEAWGEDKTEVRLVVKRAESVLLGSDKYSEDDVGEENKRIGEKRAEDKILQRDELKMKKKKQHSKRLNETRRIDTVHPRRLYEEKSSNKESIQQLMKIIIAQGSTIQSQLQVLKDREKAIETFEQKVHNLRMKESGKDYVLQTYLDQLPAGLQESPKSSRRPKPAFLDDLRTKDGEKSSSSLELPLESVKELSIYLEKISRLNSDIERREEEINKLCQKTKRQMSRGAPAASVPELEELLRLPLAALEKELFLSRHELQSLLHSVSSSLLEQNKVNQEIEQIEERCSAGGIYISNLEMDLERAESEGEQLQREFDWIQSLPPSAFASQQMLDWLRKDLNEFDSDSELGLEITTSSESSPNQSNILLPDQVHPTRSTDPTRSSSTGSTSSGISSDIHSLVSPEPSLVKSVSPLPPLPPKRVLIKPEFKDEDCNSDTGLSSLNSTGEDQFSLDTLV